MMHDDSSIGRGRRCTVALMGPFGFGNLGDAAIQDAVITNLRLRLPRIRLVGISMRPADTQWRHGLDTYCYDTTAYLNLRRAPRQAKHGGAAANALGASSVADPSNSRRPSRWYPKRLMGRLPELQHAWYVFRALRHIDVLVASGGGQLDESWGGPRNHPFTLFKWTALARLRGVRVVFLSVGVGTIDSAEGRWFLRWTLRLTHQYTFRDTGSRDLANLALGTQRWAKVVPDLAFGLPVNPAPYRSDSRPGPLNVAIGVLPFYDPRMWPQRSAAKYEKYLGVMADFCRHVLEKGHRITLIVGEVNQDRVVIGDLLVRLNDNINEGRRERISAPSIATVNDLISALASADIVVADRFPGVLPSLLLERPVLALSYERKVRQLMIDLSQGEQCIELENLAHEPLRAAFDRLAIERERIQARLRSDIRLQTMQVMAQFDSFSHDLKTACHLGDEDRSGHI